MGQCERVGASESELQQQKKNSGDVEGLRELRYREWWSLVPGCAAEVGM